MALYDTFLQERKQTSNTGLYQTFLNERSGVASPKKEGYVQSAISGFARGVRTAISEKLPTKWNFNAKDGGKVWSDAVLDLTKRVEEARSELFKPGKNDYLKVAVKEAQVGIGLVNLFFAPISGALKSLEAHPVLGLPATGVNAVFAGIAEGSSAPALKALEASPFSTQTKNTLAPLVSETAALLGLAATGKGGKMVYDRIGKNTQQILRGVEAEGNPSVRTQPLNPAPKDTTPRYQEYLKTRQEEVGLSEPSKFDTNYTEFQSKTSLKLTEEARKLGIEIADDSIPIQQRMNMVESAKAADNLITADRPFAERIVFEDAPAPQGILKESVYKALERKALNEGDVALIEKLSRTTVGTEAGRALKALEDVLEIAGNPLEAIKSVREARLSAAVGRQKGLDVKKEVVKIKKEVGAIKSPTKQTWSEFIKTLEC